MKIGITGGIGTGKSYVCRLLKQRGIEVYDCDEAAKRLIRTSPIIYKGLCQLIGPDAFLCQTDKDEHTLNKAAVTRFLLQSDTHAQAINDIVHPAVFRDFEAWKAERPDCALVAFESAILLDRGLPEGFADYVIYVDAPEELRLRRAMERDGSAAESVRRRMQSQKAGPEHPAVDFVLDNSGDFKALEAALDGVLRQIASEKL